MSTSLRPHALVALLAIALGALAVFHRFPAHAQEPAPEEADRLQVRCQKGADSRQIVQVPTGVGCVLYYNKNGGSQEVASSLSGTKICDKVQAKIRSNLEKSGFACR